MYRTLVLPHTSTPYIKYGNTKELYKWVNVFPSKKFLILYKMPLDLAILFLIYIMCKFQFNLSSIITHRNFVDVTWEMILSWIITSRLLQSLSRDHTLKVTYYSYVNLMIGNNTVLSYYLMQWQHNMYQYQNVQLHLNIPKAQWVGLALQLYKIMTLGSM